MRACAQNLCNLIWGMARLAEHPGPELMRKFLQKSEELLDSANQEDEEEKGQGVANTLWALAVLDELRPEFVEQVRAPRAFLRTALPPSDVRPWPGSWRAPSDRVPPTGAPSTTQYAPCM